MALATLAYRGRSTRYEMFDCDIGSNRFYAYRVGVPSKLSGPATPLGPWKYKSAVFGPVPKTAHGRFELAVPSDRFDKSNQAIQLLSFRTPDGIGPARSRVLVVWRGGSRSDDTALPSLHLGLELAMKPSLSHVGADALNGACAAENVAFSVHETPLASTMFFDAFGGILKAALPMAGKLLGGLFGGGKSGSGSGSSKSAGGGILDLLQSPEGKKLIEGLLANLTKGQSFDGGVSLPSRAVQERVVAAQSIAGHRYAEAMFLPALAAIGPAISQVMPALGGLMGGAGGAGAAAGGGGLPMMGGSGGAGNILQSVMPLLQKLANPETIKAISEAIPNPAEMLLDTMNQHNKHNLKLIEVINQNTPSLDDEKADPDLATMSIGARPAEKTAYRPIRSVELLFEPPADVSVSGRKRWLYRTGHDFGFPMQVRMPDRGRLSSIAEASLEITLKDVRSLRVVSGRRMKVRDLASGALPTIPTLRKGSLRRLKTGEDYVFTATLTFDKKDKHGRLRRVGVSRSTLISVVEDTAFDRVEGIRSRHALDDSQRYRAFWHKIWQGTFDAKQRRATWATRYIYSLDRGRERNGRMETVLRVDDSGAGHTRGKLKTGLLLSADVLNGLLRNLELPVLTDSQLEALRTDELKQRFDLAARKTITLSGRNTEGAIWVWPEVNMLEIVLVRPSGVDAYGRVESLKEETVLFPVPSIVHFVSVRMGEFSEEGKGLLAGMRILRDEKVALYPLELGRAAPSEATEKSLV